MSKSNKHGHSQQRLWKRSARRAREARRKRIYLMSLQTMPVEKLERVFRKIRDGKIRLVGFDEEPEQFPAVAGFREEMWK